jgi:hypothetical protein
MKQATKEEMKQEALERMKLWKLHENVVREFRDDGVLNYSVGGVLYWLPDEWKALVSNWESETGSLAYHGIFDKTEFGDLLTVLYVSQDKEEWALDRGDMDYGTQCCYVFNLTDPGFSEYGSCGITPLIGGLLRTE